MGSKRIELYGGEIILDFDQETHLYTIDGKSIDGVTSILSVINKPKLNEWQLNVGLDKFKNDILQKKKITREELNKILVESKKESNRIRDNASSVGTIVHEWIERFISHPITIEYPEDNSPARGYIDSFIDFMKKYRPRFLESERVVYSKKYKYCGTLDFIAEIKGKLYLGDFKTSKSIRRQYDFQTAAYQRAYEEETGLKIGGRILVKLDKGGNPEIKKLGNIKNDFDVFKAALTIYRALK